jgi:hypothetical protein
MLKWVGTFFLSLAVILTMMTLQVVPHECDVPSRSSNLMVALDMSMTHMGMSKGDRLAPCKSMTPTCTDSMGCLTGVVLPTTPHSAATPSTRGILSYTFFDVALTGRTIRPELFPPILRG